MYKALFLSPMIPSSNPAETASFFAEALGFTVRSFDSHYHICEKDGLTVHFQPMGENVGEMSFYLEVDDLDQVWSILSEKVQSLRHKAPFTQPYGMREVHVDIPFTKTLLFIGQSL
jgi:hypothetical protein